jgi:hypothetical protein
MKTIDILKKLQWFRAKSIENPYKNYKNYKKLKNKYIYKTKNEK